MKHFSYPISRASSTRVTSDGPLPPIHRTLGETLAWRAFIYGTAAAIVLATVLVAGGSLWGSCATYLRGRAIAAKAEADRQAQLAEMRRAEERLAARVAARKRAEQARKEQEAVASAR